MSDIIKQVIAGLILTAILGLLTYIARHLLARLWKRLIRFIKNQPKVFVLVYILLLASLELGIFLISADGLGTAIAIVQLPLFLGLVIMLRERYLPPQLRIISAKYGTNGQTNDVTKKLQSLVKDGTADFTVNNGLLGGDPYPGVAKRLELVYLDQHEITVEENKRLNIPEPKITVIYSSSPLEND